MPELIIKELEKILTKDQIKINEPLKNHTTFRVGGPCKAFLHIRTTQELQNILSVLSKYDEKYFVIGNGSNLLVSDKGFDGFIIRLEAGAVHIDLQNNQMTVPAGILMSKAAKEAAENGLSGLEFAAGIPGTMGGGVIMNAGAYGGELKQVVRKVTYMTKDGILLEKSNEQMEFGYRKSALKSKDCIVTEVVLELFSGDRNVIFGKMEDLAIKRREKQPLEYPSAGSTFKRPEGFFAGKLIEDSGLRGYAIGGACVSEKHCGFVINRDHATAKEIKTLIQDVQNKVEEKFHVQLEPEIIFLGED